MTKIYIGNLPETGRRTDLLALFEKYGKVTECDIIKNYGFVHMETEQDAKAAIDGLHEYDFQGSQISVELSRSKVRTKPGMGSQGQCYKCGRSGHWSKDCPRGPTRGRGDGHFMEPPFRVPMPGYRERLYGRYPPDRMRPYPDPYDRRPPPPPDREYFRSRSPFGAPRYPPEDYYYHRRSPPRRFASDQFMRFDFDPYEPRGRVDLDDSEELFENDFRPDGLRRGFREDGFRGLRPGGLREEAFRPGGFREDGLRPGFREDGLRPGFREDGLRPGGFREDGLRPGGFREDGLRPGGFREDGLRPGGFREGGLRPGGFRDGPRPGGFGEEGLRPRGFGEGHRAGGFSGGLRSGGFGEEALRSAGFSEGSREGLILKDLFRRAGILHEGFQGE